MGGEALVAAILGKIDAIEVGLRPRKVPLMPWVYRLWDAGFLVPLVGASAKDSNRVALGAMRTFARVADSGRNSAFSNIGPAAVRSWVEAIRAGYTFATTGPMLHLRRENGLARVSVRARESEGKLELIANGEVRVAKEAGEVEMLFQPPAGSRLGS